MGKVELTIKGNPKDVAALLARLGPEQNITLVGQAEPSLIGSPKLQLFGLEGAEAVDEAIPQIESAPDVVGLAAAETARQEMPKHFNSRLSSPYFLFQGLAAVAARVRIRHGLDADKALGCAGVAAAEISNTWVPSTLVQEIIQLACQQDKRIWEVIAAVAGRNLTDQKVLDYLAFLNEVLVAGSVATKIRDSDDAYMGFRWIESCLMQAAKDGFPYQVAMWWLDTTMPGAMRDVGGCWPGLYFGGPIGSIPSTYRSWDEVNNGFLTKQARADKGIDTGTEAVWGAVQHPDMVAKAEPEHTPSPAEAVAMIVEDVAPDSGEAGA